MEEIIICVAKAVVFFISIVLYLKLFSSMIPGFIMRLRCKKENTRDRGIKKLVYQNGRCVVYEPELNFRKYVSKYALFTEDGYKYMQCKLASSVHYIRFDVYAFDNTNKLIDVINVNEYVDMSEKYTSKIALPPETSYTRLVLRKVDNQYAFKGALLEYSPIRYAICGSVIALATAIELTVMYSIFKDFFEFLLKSKSDLVVLSGEKMLVVGIIVTCIVTGLTLLSYYRNSKRVMNK